MRGSISTGALLDEDYKFYVNYSDHDDYDDVDDHDALIIIMSMNDEEFYIDNDNSDDDIIQELPRRVGSRQQKFFGIKQKTLELGLQGTARFHHHHHHHHHHIRGKDN